MIMRLGKTLFVGCVVCSVLLMITGAATASPSRSVEAITVTTTIDEYDVVPNSTCSLREAITASNTNSSFGGCQAPDGPMVNTIILANDFYYLSLGSAGDDANQGGDLDIFNNNIVIEGHGAVISSYYMADRVFDIGLDTYALFYDMHIRDGNGVAQGGGIFNKGYLVMFGVILSRNTSNGSGGAIASAGRIPGGDLEGLQINDVEIYDNQAATSGGGIDFRGDYFTCERSIIQNNLAPSGAGLLIDTPLSVIGSSYIGENGDLSTVYGGGLLNYGTMDIRGSIFYGNTATSGGNILNWESGTSTVMEIDQSEISFGTASYGGGIENVYNAQLTIKYSTISNNSAFYYGGGILQWSDIGQVALDHVTLANNDSISDWGDTIAQYIDAATAKPVRIDNSIIAGWSDTLCFGSVDPASHHNLETGDTCGLLHDASLSNFVNTIAGIGPLKNNGGKGQKIPMRVDVLNTVTWTHALSPDSLAVDSAVCIPYTSDQRGIMTPFDGNMDGINGCDRGAYEISFLNYLPLLMRP
jgi:CSLREA domain-containing protein